MFQETIQELKYFGLRPAKGFILDKKYILTVKHLKERIESNNNEPVLIGVSIETKWNYRTAVEFDYFVRFLYFLNFKF